MVAVRVLSATDPALAAALAAALAGGPPLAPLPVDPRSTLAMLRPDEPVPEPDAALIVTTSGSTGTPKGVVLSRRAVLAGVHATHARLGGPGAWTLALPAHYVAGIMVMARAVVAGTTLHRVTPDLSDLPHPRRRTYLSLVPTQLVRALENPATTKRLAAHSAILLGGAPVRGAILDRCRAIGLRVVPTYGSSETAGGCVYAGAPLDGIEVALEQGRVVITGDVVFSGYRLRPDLTAGVLTGRTFRTSDRAEWRDGRLHILGRIDDVVVCGGVNVDLAAVERALNEIDPTAAALGVPDPEWGTRIIVATASGLSLSDFHARLGNLEPPARPRGLLRSAHLPRTSSGKIDRARLRGWWGEDPGTIERETM